MAATITADPNPVNFALATLIGLERNTTITWDTDSLAQGVVSVSRDGGQTEDTIAGGPQQGNRRGTIEAGVKLGETLLFRLRRADNDNLLASVTVTTTESAGLPLAVPDALRERQNPQGIFALRVVPGVDDVTITYRTRRPTFPFIMVRNEVSGEVALLWEADKQDFHSAVFDDFGGGLAQDTAHTYRIVASAVPGISDTSTNVEKIGRFVTGSRTATFFFDKITVRESGDPSDTGEFTFQFGAGVVDLLRNNEMLGNIETYGKASIDEGEPEDVNRVVTIPMAPRRLWAQVAALEDDDYYNPFDPGIHARGWALHFAQPGSEVKKTEYFVYGWLTDHFDINQMSGVTPFQMSTGNFEIAFDVSGRLRVDARAGDWLRPVGRPRPQVLTERVTAFSVSPGQRAMVAGVEGRAHRVIFGPDGTVYHQALAGDPRDAGNGRWTDLGGRFAGPLTVVAGAGHVSLFGLAPDGAVLHKTHAPGDRPDDDWQTLGGSFVGPVRAVAGADGAIELFAIDEDSSVSHRTLADPRKGQTDEAWERVGDGVEGPIAALFSPRTGLSLFALGRGGEVLHKRRAPQEGWESAGSAWESLGVASEGTLSAEWVGNEVLLLCVVAEDETVRVLAWPRYPEEGPREGWQTIGTVNSLLRGQLPLDVSPTAPDELKGT